MSKPKYGIGTLGVSASQLNNFKSRGAAKKAANTKSTGKITTKSGSKSSSSKKK